MIQLVSGSARTRLHLHFSRSHSHPYLQLPNTLITKTYRSLKIWHFSLWLPGNVSLMLIFHSIPSLVIESCFIIDIRWSCLFISSIYVILSWMYISYLLYTIACFIHSLIHVTFKKMQWSIIGFVLFEFWVWACPRTHCMQLFIRMRMDRTSFSLYCDLYFQKHINWIINIQPQEYFI